MIHKKPNVGKFKYINMSPEQKALVLAKLAEAKAKAIEKNDPDTEALIDAAISLASVPPDDDDGGDPPD